jgi:hypothetical protein
VGDAALLNAAQLERAVVVRRVVERRREPDARERVPVLLRGVLLLPLLLLELDDRAFVWRTRATRSSGSSVALLFASSMTSLA